MTKGHTCVAYIDKLPEPFKHEINMGAKWFVWVCDFDDVVNPIMGHLPGPVFGGWDWSGPIPMPKSK